MFIILIVELFTIAMLMYDFYVIWRGLASRHWPSTQGSIYSSEVKIHKGTRSRYGSSSTSYYPLITYTYRVGGVEYMGSRISMDDLKATDASDWAKRVAKKYPTWSSVEVFYDPSDPNKSVLDRSTPTWGHYLLAVGLLGMSIGLAALLRVTMERGLL